jgi:hypothetical protein
MNLVQSTLLNVMKIPHFGRHHEVNACVNILLSCYHGGYLWINWRITVDLMLIHRITGLSMQQLNPHNFYLGKASNPCLGTMRLAYQLIAGKIVIKNRPTQVTRFFVDLVKKCVEGLQMNWVKYLVNQLELDCREAQDQGYEFHFSWLLILITFTTWEMLEVLILWYLREV